MVVFVGIFDKTKNCFFISSIKKAKQKNFNDKKVTIVIDLRILVVYSATFFKFFEFILEIPL